MSSLKTPVSLTVTLSLAPEDEEKLRTKAAVRGQDVAGFIQRIVQKELATPPSFDEILAPFRQEVEVSGVTDEELEGLFRQARAEVWREKPPPQKGAP